MLLGAARPADQGAFEPLAAQLRDRATGEGIAVKSSREIVPDLTSYDLVHLLAAPPIDRAARQFFHARRWGCPVVVSVLPPFPVAAERADDPVLRYERGLWRFLVRGADRVVALTDGDSEPVDAGELGREGVGARLAEPLVGRMLREVYAATVQERTTMSDAGVMVGQWLPGLPPEEYAKHLEDLCQLQLELIAYRDAEYEALRRQLAEAGEGDGAGLRALKGEYERLGEWSRDVAARHEALQAEYERLRRWSGELEAQLRAARPGRLRRKIARWFGRG